MKDIADLMAALRAHPAGLVMIGNFELLALVTAAFAVLGKRVFWRSRYGKTLVRRVGALAGQESGGD